MLVSPFMGRLGVYLLVERSKFAQMGDGSFACCTSQA
jgi:hypothetical protein